MRTMRGAALAAALGVLVATGCGGRRGAAGEVRSSALGTYPRESVALLVLEIKKIRGMRPDTPWLKDMAALANREGGPFQEVIRRLGPEFLARLDRLSLAVVPRPDRTAAYGILAEGTFDAVKVRQALGGQDALTLVETGQMDVSVALLPGGSLALGPKSVLETMSANAASRGHGLDASPEILTPLQRVRPEAQFWGAIDCRSLQRLFKDASAAPDFGRLPLASAPLQSLVSIAFRGTLADSVDIDLFGRAGADKDARTLADAARGLVALGRVGAGREQASMWLDFLDAIRIDQKGAEVNLRASIPAKTMESFVAQVMSAPRPAPESPLREPTQPAPRNPPVPSRPSAPPRGPSSPAGSPSPAPAHGDNQTPSAAAP